MVDVYTNICSSPFLFCYFGIAYLIVSVSPSYHYNDLHRSGKKHTSSCLPPKSVLPVIASFHSAVHQLIHTGILQRSRPHNKLEQATDRPEDFLFVQ